MITPNISYLGVELLNNRKYEFNDADVEFKEDELEILTDDLLMAVELDSIKWMWWMGMDHGMIREWRSISRD